MTDYAKFLSLAVPRDPPSMPLGIGESLHRVGAEACRKRRPPPAANEQEQRP